MIRDVPPEYLVEERLLATGRSARRLVARDIAEIAGVDRLAARLPLVLDEPERSRSDDVLELLVGRGCCDASRHHKRHVERRLAERVDDGTEPFAQLQHEGLLVDCDDLRGLRHQQPTEAVLLAPALEGLDTVLGDDRLAVVPLETVAQREDIFHAVLRHA